MYGIEYLRQELLEEACRMRASDVHIVPKEKEASVSFRVDSDLIQQRTIDKKSGERLIAHFKFLSSMDIGGKKEAAKWLTSCDAKKRSSVYSDVYLADSE